MTAQANRLRWKDVMAPGPYQRDQIGGQVVRQSVRLLVLLQQRLEAWVVAQRVPERVDPQAASVVRCPLDQLG